MRTFNNISNRENKNKKVYELEGNIGAGITAIMNIIKSQFNEVEFVEEPVNKWLNVVGNNLLESFYSNPKRWGSLLNFILCL